MSSARHVGRRDFLKHASLGVAAVASVPRLVRANSPAPQLQVACVGVDGMGWSDLSRVGSHPAVKFVGFCDIDSQRFAKADDAFPGVRHFADYREMLSDLGQRIDAVIVSTPDHMHAPVAMEAMRMGKHIYCQKPLTHTVWESRQMRLLAQQQDLTTQMGNQIHSAKEYRSAVQLIQQGVIGKVQEVHSWVRVQGRQYCQRIDRPPAAEVPANVNWDLWLGAAPKRPFAADVYHPFKWRDWQDFGSGALGDFGCHLLDPVFGALGIRDPSGVIAEHAGTNDEVWPGPQTVTFTFPGTKYTADDEIKLVWRDGGLRPPLELAQMPAGTEFPPSGSLLIGQLGTMVLPHVGMPRLYPDERFAALQYPEVEARNHWHDWVDAIIQGKKTTAGFEYAGPLSETVQLGNIAARLPGKNLQWDAEGFAFVNQPQADKLLSKVYRDGFGIKPVV